MSFSVHPIDNALIFQAHTPIARQCAIHVEPMIREIFDPRSRTSNRPEVLGRPSWTIARSEKSIEFQLLESCVLVGARYFGIGIARANWFQDRLQGIGVFLLDNIHF